MDGGAPFIWGLLEIWTVHRILYVGWDTWEFYVLVPALLLFTYWTMRRVDVDTRYMFFAMTPFSHALIEAVFIAMEGKTILFDAGCWHNSIVQVVDLFVVLI